MSNSLSVVILAAGQGTRMKSNLPKVLHEIAGKPLLRHVVEVVSGMEAVADIHVVYGHGGEKVKAALGDLPINWVLQDRQLGTGHALEQAMPEIADGRQVLVLYGDVPLITRQTLERLVQTAGASGFGLLTATLAEPQGYGRIVRDDSGEIVRIVEEKDASDAQLRIQEINTGMLVAPAEKLRAWLKRLENNNAQGEFYLTDVIELAARDAVKINSVSPGALVEIEGVNNKLQLANLERAFQRRQAEQLMLDGVQLLDPARFDLRGFLQAGKDVVIDANVIIEGTVQLGSRVRIGTGVVVKDCVIADDVEILPYSVLENASIDRDCHIGPFARIRPETQLLPGVKIGNFVEIKKSTIAENSKVNHLSYIGDSSVGKNVNIGAGTITCNYDGANKHKTIIEDDVFVGSDTQLVAPVRIGAGATIGAGSTITKDVPAAELALSRVPQVSRKGWERPKKQPKP